MYEVESSFSGGSQLADITESIHFNGANGSGSVLSSFGVGTSFPITVSFWWKRMQTGVTHRVFHQFNELGGAGGGNSGIGINIEDGAMSAIYGNGSTFYILGSAAVLTGLTLGNWNHFFVEFVDASTINFTANNGTQRGGTYVAGSVTTLAQSAKSYFGALPWLGSYSQQKIYALRTYNKLLNSTEKTADYNKELTGDEAAIAGNATGTTWEDYTGGGNNITISGSFAIDTDIPT